MFPALDTINKIHYIHKHAVSQPHTRGRREHLCWCWPFCVHDAGFVVGGMGAALRHTISAAVETARAVSKIPSQPKRFVPEERSWSR